MFFFERGSTGEGFLMGSADAGGGKGQANGHHQRWPMGVRAHPMRALVRRGRRRSAARRTAQKRGRTSLSRVCVSLSLFASAVVCLWFKAEERRLLRVVGCWWCVRCQELSGACVVVVVGAGVRGRPPRLEYQACRCRRRARAAVALLVRPGERTPQHPKWRQPTT